MEILRETRDDIAILAPKGRVDSTTSDSLEQAMTRTLDAGASRLVVDFTGVDYISSAGLRVLLVAAKRLGGGRGQLVLCSLAEPVRQVFDLAGFLRFFTIAPSVQAAVEQMKTA